MIAVGKDTLFMHFKQVGTWPHHFHGVRKSSNAKLF